MITAKLAQKDMKNGTLANHRSGIGELGNQICSIVNHSVIQEGTIGEVLVNHALDDAAPTTEHFVEPITEEELAEALGLKPYAGRALSVTCKRDIIQLPEELRPGWTQIKEHFAHVGIECAGEAVWDNSFDVAEAPEYKDKMLDTFYFGRDAHRVRPDAQRLFMTECINDKSYFLRLAHMLGVPIPKTTFFATKEQFGPIVAMKYPVVFKINKSVAGLGTKVCHTPQDLASCLWNVKSGVGFHIQEYLGDHTMFISAQYILHNGHAKFITSSCNFVADETHHDGNWGGSVFDSTYGVDPNNIGSPIAKTVAQMIYQRNASAQPPAWMGIDIGLTPDGKMFPIEANLRYTAAAYYYGTAYKIGMHNRMWAGRSYASSRPLSDIDLGKIAFTPKKGRGWILTNWGPMVIGKKQEDGSMQYSGGLLYVGPPDWRLYEEEEDELKTFLA